MSIHFIKTPTLNVPHEMGGSVVLAVNSVGCSLPTGDDCDGINPYPNWTTADYAGGPNTHNEAGEIMQYGGNAYSANWYTNSIPGSDNTWSFVRSCSIN